MDHKLLDEKLMTLQQFQLRYFGRVCEPGLCSIPLTTTNGCFDIVHAGHVAYLEEAKSLVGHLTVLLNSDESVKRLKGDTRPFNKVEARAFVLAGLRSVDNIVVFDEDTPVEVLQRMYSLGVGPHIHVKAGDYKIEDLPEAKIVQEAGGKIHIAKLLEGFSTTDLVNRIGILEKHRKLVEANGIGGMW